MLTRLQSLAQCIPSNRLFPSSRTQSPHPPQSPSTNLNRSDHWISENASDPNTRRRSFMAVDRVQCATLSSAATSSSSTNSTNRTSCLVFDCGVMTNVCSLGLAHDAQSQSPTRPESSSPSLDPSADAGAATSSPASPAPSSLNTNSSAMQQLNETQIHSSPGDQMNSDSVAAQSTLPPSPTEQPAMSPNQSCPSLNGGRPEDEQRPKATEADPKPDDTVSDQEPVNRPSSRDSRTSTTAASPSSQNHNEAPASNHTPQPESDRKEVSRLFASRLLVSISERSAIRGRQSQTNDQFRPLGKRGAPLSLGSFEFESKRFLLRKQ